MRNNEAIIKNSDVIPLIMKLGSIGENVGEIKVKVFFTPSLKGRGKKTLTLISPTFSPTLPNFIMRGIKSEFLMMASLLRTVS